MVTFGLTGLSEEGRIQSFLDYAHYLTAKAHQIHQDIINKHYEHSAAIKDAKLASGYLALNQAIKTRENITSRIHDNYSKGGKGNKYSASFQIKQLNKLEKMHSELSAKYKALL